MDAGKFAELSSTDHVWSLFVCVLDSFVFVVYVLSFTFFLVFLTLFFCLLFCLHLFIVCWDCFVVCVCVCVCVCVRVCNLDTMSLSGEHTMEEV